MVHTPLRRLLTLAVTCGVLTGTLAWSLRLPPAGYGTPAECVDAFRDACRTGDAARYRRCLGDPLRSEVRQTCPGDDSLAESLRREARGLKGWVQVGPPDEQRDRAVANVEEVRETGQRRLRLWLERSSEGWLVVRLEMGAEQAPDVRYGTRVGEERAAP
jgi:hypothetical protein